MADNGHRRGRRDHPGPKVADKTCKPQSRIQLRRPALSRTSDERRFTKRSSRESCARSSAGAEPLCSLMICVHSSMGFPRSRSPAGQSDDRLDARWSRGDSRASERDTSCENPPHLGLAAHPLGRRQASECVWGPVRGRGAVHLGDAVARCGAGVARTGHRAARRHDRHAPRRLACRCTPGAGRGRRGAGDRRSAERESGAAPREVPPTLHGAA